MIERHIFDGRLAWIGYLDANWKACAKGSETIVKVIFDDGEILFLTHEGNKPPAQRGPMLDGKSLAMHAKEHYADEVRRIETVIRSGVLGGLDGHQIAGRVVGTHMLRGADGVTAGTRQKLARLARSHVKQAK